MTTRRLRWRRVVLVVVLTPVLLVAGMVGWFTALHETSGTMRVQGTPRAWLLHVPAHLPPSTPVPLVISLHGAGGWPAQQRDVSGWSHLADSLGFLVVYPAGELEGPRIWHVGRGHGLARDTSLIARLIDTIAATHAVDRTRIFASGLSNGGGMNFVLACAMPGRIAAVGLASAARTLPIHWCESRTPVPMIDFHGAADSIVPFAGGLGTSTFAPTRFDPDARPLPPVRAFDSTWAVHNGCAPAPISTGLGPGVTRLAWTGCAGGADVVLHVVTSGGHQWPGGRQFPA